MWQNPKPCTFQRIPSYVFFSKLHGKIFPKLLSDVNSSVPIFVAEIGCQGKYMWPQRNVSSNPSWRLWGWLPREDASRTAARSGNQQGEDKGECPGLEQTLFSPKQVLISPPVRRGCWLKLQGKAFMMALGKWSKEVIFPLKLCCHSPVCVSKGASPLALRIKVCTALFCVCYYANRHYHWDWRQH